MVHRRVITVGKDLETELNHAADRVLDRPFFIRESAQIVGIGRHHGKRDAPIRGALSELRIVCNRVAVVDSLTLEEIHGGFHIAPVFAEFARMRGQFKAGIACQSIGFPEIFGFVERFAVVDPQTDDPGRAVSGHFTHQFNSIFRERFAVN